MDLKKLQEKLHKKKGVLIHYDDKGCAYVSMPVGQVPLKQFEEWQKRCDVEFKGNRWLAIWTDYLRQKTFDLMAEAEALKQLANEEEEPEEPSNPLGLLRNGD